MKNEFCFEEADHRGKSYRVWLGDLWECEGCGARIVVGVGAAPVAQQHEDDYAGRRLIFRPTIQVPNH
jgi:hypothetical protein